MTALMRSTCRFCGMAWPLVRTFFYVLICAFASTQFIHAQDVWNNDLATGDWSTPGNWSLRRVPGAADSVVVDNGRTAVVSTLGGNSYTIQNLTIGSEVDGSTVEINSGVTLNVAAVTIGTGGILSLDAG